MSTKLKNEKHIATNPYEDRYGLVYARVSSKRQETEGSGLQSQEGRCKNDLHSIGVPYIKTFPDSFSGGGDFMKRPAMRALLAYIDANPHREYVVIFDDLSRFARDVEFHLKLRGAFRARNVLLRCLNFNFDESPEGRFSETVIAANAELQRHQNRRQVIQKMKARMEAGYWPFGGKKGYDMVKDPAHGKLAIPNAQGAILAEGIDLFARRILVRKVDLCRFLVEKGFWKKQSPEKYIHLISEILIEPFYAGFIEYLQWDVTRRIGKHQPIISLDTFELIQKILRRENVHKRIRQDVSEDFSLRTLLLCDHCDRPYTAAWSKGRTKRYAYYVCHNKACEYYGKSVSANVIEKQFKKLLLRNKLKPNVGSLVDLVFDRSWKAEVINVRVQQSIATSHKKSLEDRARELANAAISAKSEAVKRIYERQLEELAPQIENNEADALEELDFNIPYRTAIGKATGMLKSPYSVWRILNVSEKQRMFYFIFETKLPYNQKTGYRTDKTPQAIRLFEEFATQNPLDVDQRGIEPRTSSLQMRHSTTELLALQCIVIADILVLGTSLHFHSPAVNWRRNVSFPYFGLGYANRIN